jgi:hypothetical protein
MSDLAELHMGGNRSRNTPSAKLASYHEDGGERLGKDANRSAQIITGNTLMSVALTIQGFSPPQATAACAQVVGRLWL